MYRVYFSCLTAIACLGCGCGGGGAGAATTAPTITPPATVSNGDTTQVASNARPEDIGVATGLAADNARFAFDLYEQLRAEPDNQGNLTISPVSISTALAMTPA